MPSQPRILSLVPRLLIQSLVSCLALVTPARAGLLTAIEKNAFVVGETAAMTVSMMQDFYGWSSGAMGFGSTSFSATSWTFDLTGTYAGRTVGLTFSGFFDPLTNLGSYVSAGSIGSDIWGGDGLWSYVDLGPDTDGLNFDAFATISSTPKVLDVHTVKPKKEVTTDNGVTRHTVSEGEYQKTENGVKVGDPVDQTDDSIGPSQGKTATVSVFLTQDRVFLVGAFDREGGRINGSVQVIPEPSAWLLVGVGLAGLILGTRKRSRLAADLKKQELP